MNKQNSNTGFDSNPDTSPVHAYEGWKTVVAHYQKPNIKKSIWQIGNSFGGLLLTWALMYLSITFVGYWLALLIAIFAAGFLVRIFIIQHDCGHASFFGSRRANNIVGTICGFVTFIPYSHWRKSHAIHHAHHAQLENRGIGDVWTMTVDEYWEAGWWKRAGYRVFRNPLFLFGIAPAIHFLILQRLPQNYSANMRNGEKASVWWTNLAIAASMIGIGAIIGFGTVLVIVLPIVIIAGSLGTWLFYVQHQFEHTYWEHTPEWNYTLAAMEGSSYYHLPRLLQWFTGNIGFHHIHHLSPRIPNYNLQECHDENPLFQQAVRLTIPSSLQTVKYALWSEEKNRLVTFREALQNRPSALPA